MKLEEKQLKNRCKWAPLISLRTYDTQFCGVGYQIVGGLIIILRSILVQIGPGPVRPGGPARPGGPDAEKFDLFSKIFFSNFYFFHSKFMNLLFIFSLKMFYNQKMPS